MLVHWFLRTVWGFERMTFRPQGASIISLLIQFLRKYQRGGYFIFSSVLTKDTYYEGDITMAIGKEGQVFGITATPKSKRGTTAKIQPGTAVWESSDEAICSIQGGKTLDESGNTIDGTELQAVGTHQGEGEFLVTLKADGDPSEGVRDITGVLAGATVVGDAVAFEMKSSDPVDPPATV